MSTVGIIALSVLAALFLFALFASVGLLLWLAWSLKKTLAGLEKWAFTVYAETEKTMQVHQAESKTAIESAKGAFSAIRNEVKAGIDNGTKQQAELQAAHQKALVATLEDFRRQMQVAINKINAEALQTVAIRLTQVCVRAEKAIGVLQQLMLDNERAPGGEYGPEETAPEESRFGAPPSSYGKSLTAQFDDEADAELQAEISTEAPVEV